MYFPFCHPLREAARRLYFSIGVKRKKRKKNLYLTPLATNYGMGMLAKRHLGQVYNMNIKCWKPR